MRRLALLACYGLGILPWAFGVILVGVSGLFSKWINQLDPAHEFGNCWTYALPRYQAQGGYLLIRPAGGAKFLGLRVPHVAWVKSLGDGVDLEQFEPVAPKTGTWFPWYTLWYHGKVTKRERRGARLKSEVKG